MIVYTYRGVDYFIVLLSFISPLMTTVVLIFAIIRIRSLIKRLDAKEINARERLIRVHVFTFILVTLTSLISVIEQYKEKKAHVDGYETLVQSCRYSVALFSCLIITRTENTFLLFLFTFMSLKFSQQQAR